MEQARLTVRYFFRLALALLITAGLMGSAQTAYTQTTPLPDLTITKSGPTTVQIGERISYDITVSNNGAAPVTVPQNAVLLRDTLSGGAVFGGCFSPQNNPPPGVGPEDQYSCGGSGTTTIDFFHIFGGDVIAPGQSRSFTLYTEPVTTLTTVTNSAEVDPDGVFPESDEGNNTSNIVSTTVTARDRPQADLAVTKVASTNCAAVGEQIGYTFTATNLGPDLIIGIDIEDVSQGPPRTYNVPGFPTTRGEARNSVGGSGVILESGSSANFGLSVVALEPGTITNVATIRSLSGAFGNPTQGPPTPDPHPANNIDTARVTVVPSPSDCQAQNKLPSPGQQQPGQQQPGQQQPGQQQPEQQQSGVPVPITQQGEQDSEAGEIDQTTEVS